MALIYLGATVRFTATIVDTDGTALIPDSNEVKVYDPNDKLKTTISTGSITQGVPTNTFWCEYTIPASGKTGFWSIIWKATITGPPVRVGIGRSQFPVKAHP